MTTITKLEEIDVYKESLVLAREIYSLTRNPKIQKDYSLIDQIRRASLSVPANIAEEKQNAILLNFFLLA
jgi:four helix bundle protein